MEHNFLSLFKAWNIERAYITMLNYVSSHSFTIGLRKENIAAAGSQLTTEHPKASLMSTCLPTKAHLLPRTHTHTDEIKASLVSIHAVLSNYRIFVSGKKIKLLKKNKRMSLEILVVLPLERSWFRHFLRALKGKVLLRFKKSQIL